MKRVAVLVAVLVVAGACGSEAAPPTGEAGLSLLGPLEAEVGTVPRFEWTEVDGAAKYRLVVLGSDGPIWAWEGGDTAVNLGGLTGDRPELMPGPVIEAGTSWSVVAFDASGGVLDIVGPIEIAPAGTSATTEPAEPTTTQREVASEDLPDPCALVPQEAIDEIFGENPPEGRVGDVTGPGGTSGGRRCSWSRGVPALWLSIFISPGFLTPLEICDYCSTIDGFGDEAWAGETDLGMGGSLLAISVGGLGVQLSADGLGVTVEQLEPLAEAVLAGLP